MVGPLALVVDLLVGIEAMLVAVAIYPLIFQRKSAS